MKFEYKKEANIKIGQVLYGIIGVSIYTYDGVHSITVDDIDYNEECVMFKVNVPYNCSLVYCEFSDMENYVFETREEANAKYKDIEFGEGLFAYRY